jgi:predicted dehydrogenase
VICASSDAGAERYRRAYGFARAAADWRALVVADPEVEAVVIASPQTTHRAIAEAAFALGKPVFCENRWAPRWRMPRHGRRRRGERALANMIGFNYVRTPATQFARQLLAEGAIGRRHVVPRRAYRGFPRRSRDARQLAHDRAWARTGPWAISRPT